jgi:hypothetical protein
MDVLEHAGGPDAQIGVALVSEHEEVAGCGVGDLDAAAEVEEPCVETRR